MQYYNKKTEDEVFDTLIKNQKNKTILLDKNYNHFGASYKNKHWILIFGCLYATEKIDLKLLLEFTNKERTKISIKKLELNNQLVEAAQKYAEYLARNKIFDHIPNARKKISEIIWIENLDRSYENEKEAVKGWMNSPGHKKQIINKDYTYFGAGFTKDIWVQAFGMNS
ncbi:12948_t:CDS:2 [Cetraspora pellucida]|uniref:12948_t:CDS:1 n=1 Tax=Cetraspora pellucida TaxID=1433469 RepID=A0A9N9FR70_9GLOM|nr:12948_t:CDS:2 [Cetraspora pellucida]